MPTTTITVREATDAPGEKSLIENNQCTFAFMQLDGGLRVSTLEDSDTLSTLPGWSTLMPGGKNCIKRFEVQLSRGAFLKQLCAVYKQEIKILT